MYEEDSRFVTPDKKLKIWRYINFDKFKWLILQRALYFCSIEILKQADPYEGSYYGSEFLSKIDPKQASCVVDQMNRCGPPITVNCWHLAESECMAMWRIYSKDNKGIAIQSTVGRLQESLDNFQDSVYIGQIIYTDDPVSHPLDYPLDKFMSVMTKRKCYEFEKELRAFVWETGQVTERELDGSVRVPVNLDAMIEKIYLSPASDDGIKRQIDFQLSYCGLDKPVEKSNILERPLF